MILKELRTNHAMSYFQNGLKYIAETDQTRRL